MTGKGDGKTIGSIVLVIAVILSWWVWPFDSAPTSSTSRNALQPSDLHRKIFVMDAHTHMMNRQLHLGGEIGDPYENSQVDLPRIREGGLDAIFFSIYTPEPYYPERYELKQTLRLIELTRRQISSNGQIELALNGSDIERINGEGKIAALLDLEGSYDLDGNPLVLQALYRLGLRSLMFPAHNQDSHFADSCCDEHRWGGINDRGRELIREMNRLGMIINVAHGSTETILQVAEASEDPILYSHGGYRHFVDITRNISDEAARAIADKGGVIGLQIGNVFNNNKQEYRDFRSSEEYDEYRRKVANSNDSNISGDPGRSGNEEPFSSFEKLSQKIGGRYPIRPCCPVPPEVRLKVSELVDVIDYAVRLVGEDHVAIGADFGGAVFGPLGIDDIGDYPRITEGLVEKGYSEERIGKIMGGNLLRLIKQVTDS